MEQNSPWICCLESVQSIIDTHTMGFFPNPMERWGKSCSARVTGWWQHYDLKWPFFRSNCDFNLCGRKQQQNLKASVQNQITLINRVGHLSWNISHHLTISIFRCRNNFYIVVFFLFSPRFIPREHQKASTRLKTLWKAVTDWSLETTLTYVTDLVKYQF